MPSKALVVNCDLILTPDNQIRLLEMGSGIKAGFVAFSKLFGQPPSKKTIECLRKEYEYVFIIDGNQEEKNALKGAFTEGYFLSEDEGAFFTLKMKGMSVFEEVKHNFEKNNVKVFKNVKDFISQYEKLSPEDKEKWENGIICVDWVFEENKLTYAVEIAVRASLKHHKIEIPVINSSSLWSLTNNKTFFYKFFESTPYLPKTWVLDLDTNEATTDVILSYPAKYFVIKPPDLSHGRGIIIVPREQLTEVLAALKERDHKKIKELKLEPDDINQALEQAKILDLKITKTVLVQELISGKKITYKGTPRTATARVIATITCDGETVDVNIVDMVWLLASSPVNPAALNASTVITNFESAPDLLGGKGNRTARERIEQACADTVNSADYKIIASQLFEALKMVSKPFFFQDGGDYLTQLSLSSNTSVAIKQYIKTDMLRSFTPMSLSPKFVKFLEQLPVECAYLFFVNYIHQQIFFRPLFGLEEIAPAVRKFFDSTQTLPKELKNNPNVEFMRIRQIIPRLSNLAQSGDREVSRNIHIWGDQFYKLYIDRASMNAALPSPRGRASPG